MKHCPGDCRGDHLPSFTAPARLSPGVHDIEIGASTVVIWELPGTGEARQRRASRLIAAAFALLAIYLLIQSTWVILAGFHPQHPPLGIAWTAVTAAAMFTLFTGKARTGAALGNPVLITEGRVTLADGVLATAVLGGLVLNTGLGWWWADALERGPASGYLRARRASNDPRGTRREGAHSVRRCCGSDRGAWAAPRRTVFARSRQSPARSPA